MITPQYKDRHRRSLFDLDQQEVSYVDSYNDKGKQER